MQIFKAIVVSVPIHLFLIFLIRIPTIKKLKIMGKIMIIIVIPFPMGFNLMITSRASKAQAGVEFIISHNFVLGTPICGDY